MVDDLRSILDQCVQRHWLEEKTADLLWRKWQRSQKRGESVSLEEWLKRAGLSPEQIQKLQKQSQPEAIDSPTGLGALDATLAAKELVKAKKPAHQPLPSGEFKSEERQLITRLLDQGLVSQERLDQALAEFRQTGAASLPQFLIQKRLVEMNTISRLMQEIGEGSKPNQGDPVLAPKSVGESIEPRVKGIQGDTFGSYILLKEIARGGMGIVYKALQPGVNRVVALKVLLSGARANETETRRFQREAQVTAQVDHPNIVKVHAFGKEGGYDYFTMDFIEGKTFEALLAEKIPLRRGLRMIEKVADALGEAHSKGILHRDVKPSNILVNAQDEPFVTDFGLAKVLNSQSIVTQSGSVLGTPFYMSPEQAQGRLEEIDQQSDVYSLGVILYQLLTGALPFQAASLSELYRKIVEEEPIPPHQLVQRLSPQLERICLKALEKNKKRRYATARELCQDLRRYLEHRARHGSSDSMLSLPQLLLRWGRRNRRTTILASVGLMILLALGIWGALAWRTYHSHREAQSASRKEEALKLVQQAIPLLQEKQWPQALALQSAALALDATLVEAWLGKAQVHHAWQQKQEERQALAQALVLAPYHIAVGLANARFAEDEGEIPQALEILERLVQKETDCLEAHRVMVRLYTKLGQEKRAAEVLEQVRVLAVHHQEALLQKAIQCEAQQKFAESLAILDELLQDPPATESAKNIYGQAHLRRGKLLQRQGERDRAQYDFTQAFVFSPSSETHLLWAEALLETSQWEEARQILEKGLLLVPPNDLQTLAQFEERLADVRLLMYEFGEAYPIYQKLLGQGRRHPRLLLHCAQVSYEMGKYEEALKHCEAVLAQNTQDPSLRREVLFARGLTWKAQQQWDKAIADFQAAIALSSTPFPLAQAQLGAALFSKGQLPQAREALALAQTADIPLVHETLGRIFLQSKEFEQARQSFARCLELVPWEPRFQHLYGVCLQRLGQFEEAESYMRRALELAPGDLTPITDLMICLFDRASLEEMMQLQITFAVYVVQFYLAEAKDLFADRLEELSRRYGALSLRLHQQTHETKSADYRPFIKMLLQSDSPAIAQVSFSALVALAVEPEMAKAMEAELRLAMANSSTEAAKRLQQALGKIEEVKHRQRKDEMRRLSVRLHAGRDRRALAELDRTGEQAVQLLAEIAADPGESLMMRWLTCQSLLSLRLPSSVGVLFQLVQGTDLPGRILSCTALRKAGFLPPEAPLQEGLAHQDPFLRALAVQHVAEENLLPFLQDPDERVALYAARRLRKKQAALVEPLLAKTMASPNPLVRSFSCSTLWEKPYSLSQIPASPHLVQKYQQSLAQAILDPDPRVRRVAATRIGTYQVKSLVPKLIECLHDPNPMVRYQAITSLGWMGEGNEESMKVFFDKHEPILMRSGIFAVFMRGIDVKILSRLPELINEQDPYFCVFLLGFFGAYGGEMAVAILNNYLEHPNPYIRMAAAMGMVDRGIEINIAPLQKRLRDPEARVSRAAAAALVHTVLRHQPQQAQKLFAQMKKADANLRAGSAFGYYWPIMPSLINDLRDNRLNNVPEGDYDFYHYYLQAMQTQKSEILTVYHQYLTAAIAIYDTPRYRYERGLVSEQLGNIPQALKDAQAAVQMAPDQLLYHILLGRLWVAAQRGAESLATAETIAKLDPRAPELWKIRGDVYRYLQQWAEAEKAYERRYLIQPADIETLLTLGQCRLKRQQWDSARQSFLTAAHFAPGQSTPLLYEIATYLGEGKRDLALARLKEIHQRIPFSRRELAKIPELHELLSDPWVQQLSAK